MELSRKAIEEVQVAPDTSKKIPLKEKISYALGDTASNFIWAVVSTYLTFYFTDVYGIGASAVGLLLLISRFVDMIDSPIFGILIDKTNTRWGKSRPWLLWLCIPFAIASILLFMGPQLSDSGKLAYAYICYIAVSVLYAGINTPLTTMLPNLTSDIQERTVANVFRMLGGQFGSLIINLSLLPLVAYLGAGNQQKGFFYSMTFFSVLALILFLITFFNTKERVQSTSGQESLPVKEGLKALKGNRPWFAMFIFGLLFFIIFIMKLSSGIYYITYNVGKPEYVSLINSLGMLTMIGIFAVPFLTKKFNKIALVNIGMFAAAMGQLIIFLGGQSLMVLIVGTIVGAVGFGIPLGLFFTVMADTVDYGEWKSGVRAQGILISTSGISQKLGIGLGGAIPAWILAAGGYVPNQPQTETALQMIAINFIWLPLLLAVLSILVLAFGYKWEKPHHEIVAELEARRLQN